MTNIIRVFSNVAEMASSTDKFLGSSALKGTNQRFVIGKQCELPTFQKMAKMFNGGICCQQLTVKGGVFLLSLI